MRKTYVMIDGALVEKGKKPQEQSMPKIMPDIQPYKSTITGEIISSRSKHRQHLKDHGMVEVGNDSSLTRPYQGMPDADPKQRKELLIHHVNQISDRKWRRMSEQHRQAVIRYLERGGKD